MHALADSAEVLTIHEIYQIVRGNAFRQNRWRQSFGVKLTRVPKCIFRVWFSSNQMNNRFRIAMNTMPAICHPMNKYTDIYILFSSFIHMR